ncbi:MAG TPA: hypothetical protein PLA68_17435, partial [Panacibacter sp.]|nr:hypothetical protein [Panacibacter sp.]
NISYKATFTLPPESKDVIYADDESVNDCETPPGDPFFDCKSAAASLKYDVYYPKNHRYDLEASGCPLPAFIFFHAGGFKECTDKQLPLATTLCAEMAKRGFVAFSVEYRRGRVLDLIDNKYTSAQQQLAFYRAAQDVRGAIRSIIRKQQNHSTDFPNDPYQIDIDNVFIGGASAGAFAANIGAWYSTSMVADVFPSVGTYTIEDVLGSINADYYYGNPSYNYHNKIKAVLNCWGGIQVPYSFRGDEEDFFSSSLVTPVIAFHGKRDHTVWYDEQAKQKVKFSPSGNAQYNSVSDCLDGKSFTLPASSTPTLISTCSS